MKSSIAIKPLAALILITLSTYSTNGASQGKQCTESEALAADRAMDGLHSWDDIHRAFKRYRHCDEGAIGEGFSEVVVKRLAVHWNELQILNKLIMSDPPFRSFVIDHIGATNDPGDLRRLVDHTKRRCPVKSSRLCGEIQKEALRGLRENSPH